MKLGKIGDKVTVKNGYGRNFLLKGGKALRASKENIELVNKKKIELNKKDEQTKKEFLEIAKKIENKKISFYKESKDNGELYGSIKPKEISTAFINELKVEVGPSQIELKQEINKIGEYKININLYSAYLMTSLLLPKMLEKKKGSIVIVSSAASNVKGAPNRFIYGTTKAALNGFVKAIAVDHVKDGIRCNAILPGTVETPSWEGRVNMAEDPNKARKDFIARQAMGRLAQPEEIAKLAVYLASDESDFVTGTLNLIDGGWTL